MLFHASFATGRYSSMMTTVFFVRHAEPNYENHQDMLRELSAKGLQDRKRVTDFLTKKKIDVVLSSPYKRAVDTLKDFADRYGFDIQTIVGFRERKVDDVWIEDFTAFTKRQWADFSYKLSNGECLQEVQDRNIAALKAVLEQYRGKSIVIGTHGTALSTVIRYYNPRFGYDEFAHIRSVMPWIVELTFDENDQCIRIRSYEEL